MFKTGSKSHVGSDLFSPCSLPAGEADIFPGNLPCRGHAAGQSGRGR